MCKKTLLLSLFLASCQLPTAEQICRSFIPTMTQPMSPSCTYLAMQTCRICRSTTNTTTVGCALEVGADLCCLGQGWEPEPSAEQIGACLNALGSGLCDRTLPLPAECAWLRDRSSLTGCP